MNTVAERSSDTPPEASINLLNRHLAAAIDLHAQLKQAHWNVVGPNFIAIHELFDRIASEVEDLSDLLAERARALGAPALGTLPRAMGATFLPPYTLQVAEASEHLAAVALSLSAFERSATAAIDAAAELGDPLTADLFTEIGRAVSKQRWFVDSHLPQAKAAAWRRSTAT